MTGTDSAPDSQGASDGKPPRVNKRWIFYMAATVIPLTIAVYAGVEIAARRAMEDARQLWDPKLGTEEQLRDRYPHREANAAALRVEQLAMPLGIRMAPRSFLDRAEPTKQQLQAQQQIKTPLWTYVDGELQRPDLTVQPPPADVRDFLDAHRVEIDALRDHLLDGPAPQWELHLERLWQGPLPNIVGHASLQRLLVADALTKIHDGDRPHAVRTLQAGWTLNQAIADDPMVMTQLVSIAVARFHSGALRKAAPLPPAWRDRLHAHDYRASLREALRVQGWMLAHTDNLARTLPDDLSLRKIFGLLKLPYTKLDTARVSQAMYTWVAALEQRDSLCPQDDHLQLQFASAEPLPHRRLAGIYLPEVRPSIDRLGRLLFDLELTDRWLWVADRVRQSGGVWPEPLGAQARSSLCPTEQWSLDAAPDGTSATLRFSRPDIWKELRGPTQLTTVTADAQLIVQRSLLSESTSSLP
jgi:hypothetical protein